MKRSCILVVLDGLGIGPMPDSSDYGDDGANTLKHVTGDGTLPLPNLEKFGLYNLLGRNEPSKASWSEVYPKSIGKSSIEGHWEMMGITTKKKMPTYPEGFSEEILNELSSRIGRDVLFGEPASGTEIIDRLGGLHMETGSPIIYTSADSVLQIAAHEDVIPVKELYEICYVARHMMVAENEVARIIARPFVGTQGNFKRTNRRKDFPIQIPTPNNLLRIREGNVTISCIGRTTDFFNNYCTRTDKPVNIEESLQSTKMYKKLLGGFIFLNLGDFDSKYGHRRDIDGFANELKKLDGLWESFLQPLTTTDLLIVTSDHGNDPTNTSHTDHTREKTFVLALSKGFEGVKLENIEMVDISATICDFFGITPETGKSFLDQVMKKKKKRTTDFNSIS